MKKQLRKYAMQGDRIWRRAGSGLLLLAAVWVARAALAEEGAKTWRRASGPLTTRWGAEISPEKIGAEYPRPQMERADWQSLNGLWEYAIRPKAEVAAKEF